MRTATERHPTLQRLLGSLLQSRRKGVNLNEALAELSRDFERRVAGERRPPGEFDDLVAWTVSQRLGEPDPDEHRHDHGAMGPSRSLRFTDVDNSTRLIGLHGDRLRYVPKWKRWLVWGGHAWVEDPDKTAVTELAKGVSSALYHQAGEADDPDKAKRLSKWAAQTATRYRIESMVYLARSIDGVPVDPDDLDLDPWLFGVRNGVVDLRTGDHRPGDPTDLMTRQAPVDYDADAECPTWDRCMTEWFPGPDTRTYAQRLAGSVIAAKQVDHRFIIHYGEGGNGKGTFVGALAHLLGPYFTVPDKRLIVDTGRSESELLPARAALYRARLAVADETDKRQKLKEASVKNLTGNDLQAGRFLYGNQFSFTPTHSLWLTTNKMPEIRGRDRGIWRRIEVVPWLATFAGKREDRKLDDKLAAETAGILNWLIAGCLDWQKAGLAPSDQIVNVTAAYRDAEDILGRFARDHGLIFQPGLETAIEDIRTWLTAWCSSEGIQDAPSRSDVARWLEQNGAESKRYKRPGDSKKKTWWRGIGVGDEIDETLENTGPDTRDGGSTGVVSRRVHGEGPVEYAPSVSQEQSEPAETVATTDETPNPAEPSGRDSVATEGLACPLCGTTPKAIYPSGLCGDCDAETVAP